MTSAVRYANKLTHLFKLWYIGSWNVTLMQKEFHMKETIPNYKWCLCMIRFLRTVRLASQMRGYYFLLFIVPLNPFGIKFMSQNRFDCVCFISRDLPVGIDLGQPPKNALHSWCFFIVAQRSSRCPYTLLSIELPTPVV
jgi:hypothetical protein